MSNSVCIMSLDFFLEVICEYSLTPTQYYDVYLLKRKKNGNELTLEYYSKNFFTSFDIIGFVDLDECFICFSNKSNVCRNLITGFIDN